jgi:hypothetical protein
MRPDNGGDCFIRPMNCNWARFSAVHGASNRQVPPNSPQTVFTPKQVNSNQSQLKIVQNN